MQIVVEFAFVDQLWMFGVGRFYFNRNFEVSFGVDGLVDLAKCTLVNFSDDFEILPHLL